MAKHSNVKLLPFISLSTVLFSISNHTSFKSTPWTDLRVPSNQRADDHWVCLYLRVFQYNCVLNSTACSDFCLRTYWNVWTQYGSVVHFCGWVNWDVAYDLLLLRELVLVDEWGWDSWVVVKVQVLTNKLVLVSGDCFVEVLVCVKFVDERLLGS